MSEKSETKKSESPEYVTFVAEVLRLYGELGIPLVTTDGTPSGLPENKGWVRFESAVNGHKVYVPKSVGRMGMVETTLPIQHLNGARPLPKVNGKIMCRHLPDATLLVGNTADLMADPADRLPANRRPAPKAKAEAQQG